MEKYRMVILASVLIVTAASSALVVAMVKPTSSVSKPQDPLFTYTAKFICNIPVVDSILNTLQPNRAETIGLVPGEYKTDINVHNANLTTSFTIKKEFVVAVPEALSVGNNTKVLLATVVGPDGAFFIDCKDILSHLPGFCLQTPFGLICKQPTAKGYVVLTTDTPNLDVVAEYTALSVNATVAPFQMTGISLDVEHIRAVQLSTCTPDCTITATPSSLTIARNFTGTSTITACSLCGFTGTCVLSFTVAPAGLIVTSSLTSFVLLPGQCVSSTLSIFAPSTIAPGIYTITVTKTCTTPTGVITRVTTITVTVT